MLFLLRNLYKCVNLDDHNYNFAAFKGNLTDTYGQIISSRTFWLFCRYWECIAVNSCIFSVDGSPHCFLFTRATCKAMRAKPE